MEVKLPTEGTRYVQALLLTATAYLQYRAHFLPAVAAYRGYGRPAVPKVPVQALRACLAIGHGTLPLPSVAWNAAKHLHHDAAPNPPPTCPPSQIAVHVTVPASRQDGAAPGREAQFRVSRYSRYAQSGNPRHHDQNRIAVRAIVRTTPKDYLLSPHYSHMV